MNESIKYYMNNPCVVVREISPELCEIQLNVHFADDINGSEWCTECLAGSGYSSHTCEEYQEVVDAIKDEEHSIFCIAETRLIHDKPVEMAAHARIMCKIEELKAELKERQELQKEWTNDMFKLKALLKSVNAEIELMKIISSDLSEDTAWSKD